MEDRINEVLRPRFFAFPVVMELETWLLADAEALNTYLSPRHHQRFERPHNPEDVMRPAQELDRLLRRWRRDQRYSKTLHGAQLFNLASAERVYDDNCPHFEALVNKLLELQGQEPLKQTHAFAQPNLQLFNQLKGLQDEWEREWQQAEQVGNLSDEIIRRIEHLEKEMARINAIISQ